MAMAVLDLVLVLVWVLVVSIVRGVVQYRRTGASPLRFRDKPGSAQWWSRLLSTIGVLFAIAAPIAELVGLAPFAVLDLSVVRFGGVVLVVLGIVVTISSQLAMGDSWRGDVDPDVRTSLVTSGPFALVRNPIFSGAALTAIGLALVVPNVLSLAMLVLVLAGLEIQVRLVEEPYLLRVHGEAYRRYAARTGRFVPGLGRLRP
jgi:protein-S-isoprenylcysteine O-methyltransferase Ste14